PWSAWRRPAGPPRSGRPSLPLVHARVDRINDRHSEILLELGVQMLFSSLNPITHAVRGHAENHGDLFVWQTQPVAAKERDARRRTEVQQHVRDQVRGFWGLTPNSEREPTPQAHTTAPSRYDREKPGAEVGRLTGTAAVYGPGVEGGVVHCVLGRGVVEEHHGGESVRGVEYALDTRHEAIATQPHFHSPFPSFPILPARSSGPQPALYRLWRGLRVRRPQASGSPAFAKRPRRGCGSRDSPGTVSAHPGDRDPED